MHQIKRNLFGYRQEDVDQYIQGYERESQIRIKGKYEQLDDIRESNQDNKLKIKATIKKIEALNQKKDDIFNSFVEQLTIIEDALKSNQEEARKNRLLALTKLQQKVDEVENWYSLLTQCFMDILAVQEKYQSANLQK
ncbi:MAG TPA: hypothetical protein VN426_10900 [Syntrophomonadaceae bacterium]|nr:hypothetical protein [Syntrophomonadaceae bacterium]